jgi:L-amino acid N-acyltransferase YncA
MLRPARREDLAAILDIANEAIRTTTAAAWAGACSWS